MMMDSVLVGDIGGTNVRFACARPGVHGRPEISDIRITPGDDFPDFSAALSQYLDRVGPVRPRRALFAIAGPVNGDTVQMTNRDWYIDAHALATGLGFEQVRLVNDYAAMARSIPNLPESDFTVLSAGSAPETRAPILVAGPGTGLGMAALLPQGEDGWHVLTGEGGHAAFAPQTEREWALAQHLRQSHAFVSNELLLSGSGLNAVHRALCEIDGANWQPLSPQQILAQAGAGDAICRDICEIRAAATLSALGDGALINGTRAGVVITGGVAERLADWLARPEALERFFQRGPMRDYMTAIPIRLLQSGQAALIGAAALHFDKVCGT